MVADPAIVNRAAYRKLRESLVGVAAYTRKGWQPARHHRLIAEALERCHRREIRRLIITMPPQHGKSELASRILPAWVLGNDPDQNVVLASYATSLAERNSREARDIVQSQEFQRLFPERALARDSNAVDFWRFHGARGGIRAVGVGSGLSGQAANWLIVDDPQPERVTPAAAGKIWEWFRSVAYTRLAPDAVVVIIMTRWQDDDLVGRVLEAQQLDPDVIPFEVLHLPAHDEQGQWLWPERYSDQEYRAMRSILGRDWFALYMGTPVPDDGEFFKADWFEIIDEAPELERWVRAWDVAASEKSHADWTAGARVGLDEDGTLVISDVRRWRKPWPESRERIVRLAREEKIAVGLAKAGMGLPMVQDLMLAIGGVPFYGYPETGSKETRASVWQSRAAGGKIKLVRGAWNADFIDECLRFPAGRHDDQVDAVSGAVALLFDKRGSRIRHEPIPHRTSIASIRRLSDYFADGGDGGE